MRKQSVVHGMREVVTGRRIALTKLASEQANVLAFADRNREIVELPEGLETGYTKRRKRGDRSDRDCIDEICELIELRTANSFEVSDMVRRGEVSFGLRYFDDPSPELISQQIAEERVVVVCSAQHKFGGKRLRDPQRLRTHQWLALPMTRHRDSFAHLVARQLASTRLDDVPLMAIDSLTAQKRLIEADIGIALLPESSIQEELRLGTLRTIDIPQLQTTVPIHVLYRKEGYLSGASRTLLSIISAAPVRPTAAARQIRKRKSSPQ
jgi:DNA-binding transcriptional LysR family regulator